MAAPSETNTTGDIVPPASAKGQIMSDELFDFIQTNITDWLMVVTSLIGVATNSVNLLAFFKQGMKDSATISVVALAVWDLARCVGVFLSKPNIFIGSLSPILAHKWYVFTYPSLTYFMVYAGYVTYLIAAYISLERCLCVAIPFKVKLLFTPRFTFLMVLSISVLTFASVSIVFDIHAFLWIFMPQFNTTLPIIINADSYRHASVRDFLKCVSILLPSLSLAVMVTCSAITVHELRKMSAFRVRTQHTKSTHKEGESSNLTRKDQKVEKMLLVIVIAYVIVLLPKVMHLLAMLAEPEYFAFQTYSNLFFTVYNCISIPDIINGAVNLFIFLKMSSNFRMTFLSIFSPSKKE